MAHKLHTRRGWLIGRARYGGKDAEVAVDLRGVTAVVYRPEERGLYLETDSCHYDLVDVSPDEASRVRDGVIDRRW